MSDFEAKFTFEENDPIKATFKAYDEAPTIGGSGTNNYNLLNNKPSINDVELVGNKTLDELGIQPQGDFALKSELNGLATKEEIPTLVSELENDSNFATQTQVMQAIASIPQFKLSIVNELPMTGEKMILYFVPKEGTDNDIYNEYVWIEQTSSYEFLGSTAVDLTDYVKKTDYATNFNHGVIKGSNYYCASVDSEGNFCSVALDLETYQSRSNTVFISKGTLDNVLTQYAKTVSLTQAEYDALTTKDANTLYLIEEE